MNGFTEANFENDAVVRFEDFTTERNESKFVHSFVVYSLMSFGAPNDWYMDRDDMMRSIIKSNLMLFKINQLRDYADSRLVEYKKLAKNLGLSDRQFITGLLKDMDTSELKKKRVNGVTRCLISDFVPAFAIIDLLAMYKSLDELESLRIYNRLDTLTVDDLEYLNVVDNTSNLAISSGEDGSIFIHEIFGNGVSKSDKFISIDFISIGGYYIDEYIQKYQKYGHEYFIDEYLRHIEDL